MFPAGKKQPLWNFYSGMGDTFQLMDWIHSQVAYPFQNPDLSLLDFGDLQEEHAEKVSLNFLSPQDSILVAALAAQGGSTAPLR